ncbi:MAG TPA: aminoacyl-tRNA hydrolase [Stellaceae bacterium]|nr:aminoacyl-tRNA hydrolase [Stellaceae bacterium]
MPIRLLVGLGNPGTRYERNRHNIGFMAVDAIVRRHGIGALRSKFQSAIAESAIAGERVLVQKPQTYMNLSGDAVGEAARFYKIAPDEIAVIHDEIDLAPGKLKVKRGGGSAGHNGLRSIDDAIGEDFWRVRLGVGHPGVKELVQPYVLQNFDAEEMQWVVPLIDAIAEALPLLIEDDAPGFMTKVALILRPPPPKPPRVAEPSKED